MKKIVQLFIYKIGILDYFEKKKKKEKKKEFRYLLIYIRLVTICDMKQAYI